VAVRVFPGSFAGPAAFSAALTAVRERFGLAEVALVGDRGMITKGRMAEVKAHPGLSFITALRAPDVAATARGGHLRLSLFDEVDRVEIRHPQERLMLCRNPHLAAERARRREDPLRATEAELEKVRAAVAAGRLKTAAAIGLRAGRVRGRHKTARHFTLEIGGGAFSYARKEVRFEAEAALGGICVIRTDAPAERVRAHAFLCLLAEHLVFRLRAAQGRRGQGAARERRGAEGAHPEDRRGRGLPRLPLAA
jgi:hypothetical protein